MADESPMGGCARTGKLFREQSLARASSPDKLDQYIRVLNPRSWMVLAVLVLLFAALAAWALVATVPHTHTARGVVRNGELTAQIDLPDGEYDVEVTVGEEPLLTMPVGA